MEPSEFVFVVVITALSTSIIMWLCIEIYNTEKEREKFDKEMEEKRLISKCEIAALNLIKKYEAARDGERIYSSIGGVWYSVSKPTNKEKKTKEKKND